MDYLHSGKCQLSGEFHTVAVHLSITRYIFIFKPDRGQFIIQDDLLFSFSFLICCGCASLVKKKKPTWHWWVMLIWYLYLDIMLFVICRDRQSIVIQGKEKMD